MTSHSRALLLSVEPAAYLMGSTARLHWEPYSLGPLLLPSESLRFTDTLCSSFSDTRTHQVWSTFLWYRSTSQCL